MIVCFSPAVLHFSPTHVYFLQPPPFCSNFSIPARFRAGSLLHTHVPPFGLRLYKPAYTSPPAPSARPLGSLPRTPPARHREGTRARAIRAGQSESIRVGRGFPAAPRARVWSESRPAHPRLPAGAAVCSGAQWGPGRHGPAIPPPPGRARSQRLRPSQALSARMRETGAKRRGRAGKMRAGKERGGARASGV